MIQDNSSKLPADSDAQAQPYYHPKLNAEQKHRLFSQAARAIAQDKLTRLIEPLDLDEEKLSSDTPKTA